MNWWDGPRRRLSSLVLPSTVLGMLLYDPFEHEFSSINTIAHTEGDIKLVEKRYPAHQVELGKVPGPGDLDHDRELVMLRFITETDVNLDL